MKSLLFAVLIAGVTASAVVRPAAAQGDEAALVKVPFQFIVGDRLLPAGTYRIVAQAPDWSVVFFAKVDGKGQGAFAATHALAAATPSGRDPQLTFNSYYGQHFLTRVAMPGRDVRAVTVTKDEAERVLAKLNLSPAERAESVK